MSLGSTVICIPSNFTLMPISCTVHCHVGAVLSWHKTTVIKSAFQGNNIEIHSCAVHTVFIQFKLYREKIWFLFYLTLPVNQVFKIDFLKNLSLSLQSTVLMPKFLLGVYWYYLTATHSVLLRTLQWVVFSTCFQNH